MYIFVYIYIGYMFIYMNVYIHTYVYKCMNLCLCLYLCVCIYKHFFSLPPICFPSISCPSQAICPFGSLHLVGPDSYGAITLKRHFPTPTRLPHNSAPFFNWLCDWIRKWGIKRGKKNYLLSLIFQKFYLCTLKERGKEGEREGEK